MEKSDAFVFEVQVTEEPMKDAQQFIDSRGYLPEGQTLALLGRNGTGKTTLINTLAGATRHPGFCTEDTGKQARDSEMDIERPPLEPVAGADDPRQGDEASGNPHVVAEHDPERCSCQHGRINRNEQRIKAARFQVCRHDDLLRFHAGGWDGERS